MRRVNDTWQKRVLFTKEINRSCPISRKSFVLRLAKWFQAIIYLSGKFNKLWLIWISKASLFFDTLYKLIGCVKTQGFYSWDKVTQRNMFKLNNLQACWIRGVKQYVIWISMSTFLYTFTQNLLIALICGNEEFGKCNHSILKVIGWWCRQCLSPANQVAFFSVLANKFAWWKTGFTRRQKRL